MKLEAFNLYAGMVNPIRLEPADWRRWWMGGAAQACVPLRLGSEVGWWLLLDTYTVATWNGRPGIGDMQVAGSRFAASHFGEGIVTFNVPYLFRTEPGWSLLVMGPTNAGKRGVEALTAIVETATTAATFTMNWRMLNAGTVAWGEGLPFAQVVPVPSNLGIDVDPVLRDIPDDPDLDERYEAWNLSRAEHNARWDRGEEHRRQGAYAREIEVGRLRTRPFHRSEEDSVYGRVDAPVRTRARDSGGSGSGGSAEE